MDELDIYDDLDEFHEQEEKKSKELLAVEKKYEETLKIVEVMSLEKKDLRKKIRIMEQNLQSLLDTAKAEIKRKDKIIDDLRKEKDDLCFRRQKHWKFIMPTEETFMDKSETVYKIAEDNKKKETHYTTKGIMKLSEPSINKLSEKEDDETDRETIRIRDDFKNKEILKKTEKKHRERRGDEQRDSQRMSRKRNRDKSRERSLSPRYRDKNHRNRAKNEHRKNEHSLRRKHWNDRRDHSRADDKYEKLDRDHKNPFKSNKSSKTIEDERKSRKERDDDKKNERNYESKRKDDELRKHKRKTSSNSDDERHKNGWNSKGDRKDDKLIYTEGIKLIKPLDCEDIESSDDDDDDDTDMKIGTLPTVKSEIFVPDKGSKTTNKKEDYNKQEKSLTEEIKQDFGFDKRILNIDGAEVKRILDYFEKEKCTKTEQNENEAKYNSSNVELETKESKEAKIIEKHTAKINSDLNSIESSIKEPNEKSFELSSESENITKEDNIENDFDKKSENFEKKMPNSDESSKSSTKDEMKVSKEGQSKIQELNNTSENVMNIIGIIESTKNMINHDDESMKKTDENEANKTELKETIKNVIELPPILNELSKTFEENSNKMMCNDISPLLGICSESSKGIGETLMGDSKNFSEKEEVELKAISIHNNDVSHCSDEGEEKEIMKSSNENSNFIEQSSKGTVGNCEKERTKEKSDNCNIIEENSAASVVDDTKTEADNIQTELKKLEEVSNDDRDKKQETKNEISINLDTKISLKNDQNEKTNTAENETQTVCVIDSSEDEMISSLSIESSNLNQASAQNDKTIMDKPSESDFIHVLPKESEISKEEFNENAKTPEIVAEEDKLAMETDDDVDSIVQSDINLTKKENTPSCIIELDDDDDGNTIFSLTLSSDDENESLAVLKNRCIQKQKEKIEILENIRLPTLFQSNLDGKKVKRTPKKQNFSEKTTVIDNSKEEGKNSRATLSATAVQLNENDKLSQNNGIHLESNKSVCSISSETKSINLYSESQTVIVINEDEIDEIKGTVEIQSNVNNLQQDNLSKRVQVVKNPSDIVKEIGETSNAERESFRSLILAMENNVENFKETFDECLNNEKESKSLLSVSVKTNLKDNGNELEASATYKSKKKTIQLEEENRRNKSKERRSLAEHNGKLIDGIDKQKPSNSLSELLSENIKESTNHLTKPFGSNGPKKNERLKISNRKKNISTTVRRNRVMDKKSVMNVESSGSRMSERSFSKQSNCDDMMKTPVKRKRLSSPTTLRNLFNDTVEQTSKTPKLSTSAEVRAMLIDDDDKSIQMSYNDVSVVSPTTCVVQDTNIDEIDRDMEALFQSPAKLDISLPITGCFPCGNSTALDTTIDETMSCNNLETTAVSDNQNKTNDSSFESKRLSLGSSEYVYERVSENVVNLFITRRRNKKPSNSNTTSPPCNVEQA